MKRHELRIVDGTVGVRAEGDRAVSPTSTARRRVAANDAVIETKSKAKASSGRAKPPVAKGPRAAKSKGAVGDFMTASVVACRPDDTLNRAAQLMWEHDVGTVVVVSAGGEPLSILTDRDLAMAAYTQGRPLFELPVTTAMSRSLTTCKSSERVEEALEKMGKHQIRRLPVVDGAGKLVGLLGVSDLCRPRAKSPKRRPVTGPSTLVARAMTDVYAAPWRTAE